MSMATKISREFLEGRITQALDGRRGKLKPSDRTYPHPA